MRYVLDSVCAAKWTGRRVLRDDFSRLRLNTPIGVRIVIDGLLRLQCAGAVFQFEGESDAVTLLTLTGMPQPIVAHLVKASWQDVLEESAHELMAGQARDAPFVCLAVLVLESDMGLGHPENATVGDGDAVDVSSQVVQYVFDAIVNALSPYHPLVMLLGSGHNSLEVWAFFCQQVHEDALDQRRQHGHGCQKALGRRTPLRLVAVDTACTYQQVDVGMKTQRDVPGMQHGHDGRRRAQVVRVGAGLHERPNGGLHQDAVAIGLVAARNDPQVLGQGKHHMIIGARQHLFPACLQPLHSSPIVARRTRTIAAAVQHVEAFATVLTLIHMPAHDLGATRQDVLDGPHVRGRHGRAVRVKIRRRESAENIRHFQSGHDGPLSHR